MKQTKVFPRLFRFFGYFRLFCHPKKSIRLMTIRLTQWLQSNNFP